MLAQASAMMSANSMRKYTIVALNMTSSKYRDQRCTVLICSDLTTRASATTKRLVRHGFHAVGQQSNTYWAQQANQQFGEQQLRDRLLPQAEDQPENGKEQCQITEVGPLLATGGM
jgi:hypothetical protein